VSKILRLRFIQKAFSRNRNSKFNSTRGQYYDIKYFRQKIGEKMAFFTPSKAELCKNLIMTLVFEKAPIFCQKLSQIAEKCDHNFDPWSPCPKAHS
jgi:hypothetical protein